MKNEMNSQEQFPPRTSFAQILEQFRSFAKETSLGEIFEKLSNRGYGVFFLILSLPSALPIPAAGYSTPFGIAIAGLALQLLAARSRPWIPGKVLNLKLSAGFIEKLSFALGFVLKYSQIFVKPRWRFVVYPFGTQVAGLSILLMACLMILPIPGTNTFPAMVIFLTGLALLEEDGILLIGTLLLGAAATLLYALLIAVIYTYGLTGISEAWKFLTQAF